MNTRRALPIALALLLLTPACSSDDAGTDTAGTSTETPATSAHTTHTSTATPPTVCGNRTCEPGEDDRSCPEDCHDGPILLHDPSAGEFHTFPDDFFTREDPTTVTGLRVDINADNMPAILDIPEGFRQVFLDLADLDGFGTSAGAFFTFNAAVDSATFTGGVDSLDPGSPLVFGWIEDGTFRREAVDVVTTDRGASLIMRPLRPIPPGVHGVAALTGGIADSEGRPLRASSTLRAMIRGSAEPPLDRLTTRYQEALQAMVDQGAIASEDDIAALTVFTTQSITEIPLAIAANIETRTHSVSEREECTATEHFLRCTFRFEVANYRTEDRAIAPVNGSEPVGFYTLTGDLYLPLDDLHGTPPPVLIFGHGLTGDRSQANRLARQAAPLGIATLAIDAPEHGDHPVRLNDETFLSMFDFFGLSTDNIGISAIALRDNWRAATADQLALVRLIRDGLDATGDGQPDVDGERILYLGVSLGAIMGPPLLAQSEHIRAAVLIVGGGRVTDILQFSRTFSPLVTLLTPSSVSRGDVARFWPLLQTAIERGDAGNWSPHVIHDRLNDGAPVQLITSMVMDDDIVPLTTNLFLARALDVPHVSPHLVPVGLIDEVQAPLTGNLPNGGTAGLLQFDEIWRNDEWREATHDNVSDSEEGIEAWLTFLEAWLDTGTGEIVDPYDRLGRVPDRE